MSSIHPNGRQTKTISRKRLNHLNNLRERAEINRQRAHSKSNDNWHGIGRHAGLTNNRRTKVKLGRRAKSKQAENLTQDLSS